MSARVGRLLLGILFVAIVVPVAVVELVPRILESIDGGVTVRSGAGTAGGRSETGAREQLLPEDHRGPKDAEPLEAIVDPENVDPENEAPGDLSKDFTPDPAERSTATDGTTGRGSTLPADPSESELLSTRMAEKGAVFHGLLMLSSRQPGPDRELSLVTSRSSRPVWTDADGAFSFVLTPSETPARLTLDGEPIYRVEEPPSARVFVNVQLIQVSRPERSLILPRAITASRGADSTRIRCFGRTRIPAGNRMILRLLGGGDRVLEGSLFTIAEGDFLGELRLPGVGYFSGEYKAVFEWKPHSASPEDIAAVEMYLPPETPGVIKRTYRFYMGRRGEELAQTEEISRFFSRAVEECLASRDLVRWIGARARGQELELSGTRLARLRRHPAFAAARRVVDGQQFHWSAWRRLIDETLPEGWRPVSRVDSIPYPEKHPRLQQSLALMYQTLNKFTRLESRMIYRARGKKPDEHDYVDIELGVETDHQLASSRILKYAKDMRGVIKR